MLSAFCVRLFGCKGVLHCCVHTADVLRVLQLKQPRSLLGESVGFSKQVNHVTTGDSILGSAVNPE